MLGLLLSSGGAPDAQQATTPTEPSTVAQLRLDDGRAQYPAVLANAFIDINVGSINYPFSSLQLEPGYHVESVEVPHAAVRAVLFGKHFGRYLSAQASYMRPARYVEYSGLDDGGTRSAWMAFGSVSLLSRLPITRRVSVYGEGGLAITNRRGFEIGNTPVVKDATFWGPLVGSGIELQINRRWDAVAGLTYVAGSDEHQQPGTTFTSAGFRYNLRPLPDAQVAAARSANFAFPAHLVQVGYSTNALGYGWNNMVSGTVPIFWGGDIEVKRSALTVQYQRGVFHTTKLFSLDVGVRFASWKSRELGDRFHTLSVYPLLRLTFLRTGPADFYGSYSVAGPTYISRTVIDGRKAGGNFTFQDFMAFGAFIGSGRHLNLEVEINHYSNGNILSENPGIKIPLTFKIGYGL